MLFAVGISPSPVAALGPDDIDVAEWLLDINLKETFSYRDENGYDDQVTTTRWVSDPASTTGKINWDSSSARESAWGGWCPGNFDVAGAENGFDFIGWFGNSQDPAEYGLSGNEWTELQVGGGSNYVEMTGEWTDCDGTSSANLAAWVPLTYVWLPNTPAQLNAAPVGATFSQSYNYVWDEETSNPAHYEVSYTAIKRDPDPSGPEFSWEVLPRSQGVNGNLFYKAGKWSEPLPATKTFMVRFDGCDNGGTAQFTVAGVQMEPDCALTWPLSEGAHDVTVDVLDGPNAGTTTQTIDVVHHLVVGLGDSFGSGESAGNDYEWDNANCRRAGWSAQARAAVALEHESPHSTVTFLHLACSGATVKKGVLGPYPDPPGKKKVPKSQVRQAADLTAGWDIDALLLSVGGNDIGFADVLSTCAAQRNCPLTKFRTDTKLNTTKSKVRLHETTEKNLSRLVGKYAEVAGCLTGGGLCAASDWKGTGSLRVGATEAAPAGNPMKVLISEYPDLATRTGGRGMKSPEGYTYCKNALKGFSTGDGIQDEEFAWAREVVQRGVAGSRFTYRKDLVGRSDKNVQLSVTSDGLNQVINAGPEGWTPITGTFDAFSGHGYCAEDKAWVTAMKLSYIANNKTAAFHPNKKGYAQWGSIIGDTLTSAMDD